MRKLTGVVVVFNMLFWSQIAVACSCKTNISLAKRSASADVIMVAEIVGVSPLSQAIVRPIEVIKGRVSRTLSVSAARIVGCDSWSSPPPVGGRYLLYLSRRDGQLEVKVCTHPRLITESMQELISLRELYGQSIEPAELGR